MSKTKQELERENAALREQNEAMRGLIAVIRAALMVPQAVWEDARQELEEYTRRTAFMLGVLAAFSEGVSARAAAATITGLAAEPVTYRVYKPAPAVSAS